MEENTDAEYQEIRIQITKQDYIRILALKKHYQRTQKRLLQGLLHQAIGRAEQRIQVYEQKNRNDKLPFELKL